MCLHGDGFQWFKMVGDLWDLDHDGGNGSDINCGYVRTVYCTLLENLSDNAIYIVLSSTG